MFFKQLIDKYATERQFFVVVALICAMVLIGSCVIEHVLLIPPCILCTIQRLLFLLILITSVTGLINNIFIKWFIKNFFNWLLLISIHVYAVLGALVAAKQSWLQVFAKFSIASCSAGLQQLLKQYSLIRILLMAIQGKLECSTIGIKILGLSLANWGLITFIIILLFSILIIYQKISNRLPK